MQTAIVSFEIKVEDIPHLVRSLEKCAEIHISYLHTIDDFQQMMSRLDCIATLWRSIHKLKEELKTITEGKENVYQL